MTHERSVDELFAELPEGSRRALEEAGLGLPELRRRAAGEGGMRRVAGILSEFSVSSRPRRFDGEGPLRWLDVRPWLWMLLVAVAGFAVCELLNPLMGDLALFVGLVFGVGVRMAGFGIDASRRDTALRRLTVLAYHVLIVVATFTTHQWYLQLRGVEQTVTITTPDHTVSRGFRQTYCRVRTADGSAHRVLGNRENCAAPSRIGDRATAVVDPSGLYGPFLGRRTDMDSTLPTAVSLTSAAVLLLAPATAVVRSRPRRLPGTDGATG
ncbi:hypothetical protein [Streptomyces sp. NPDC057616]|uniref:hypothetical protein n=1 Tax=Streptomyces sp. NPDC057616 TaxID=3346183 RepID=UPI0036CF1DB1